MRDVALIGAGFIADAHLDALRSLNQVRVSAVVDPNLSRAEALVRKAGGGAAFRSIDELLEMGKPDVAHVLTPPPLHRSTAEPLLRAGVSVLLEKPMAETPEDCAALMKAAADGGAALKINHNFIQAVDGPRFRALDVRLAAQSVARTSCASAKSARCLARPD